MTAPSGATERSNCKTQCASLSLFTFTSSAFVLFFHFNFKTVIDHYCGQDPRLRHNISPSFQGWQEVGTLKETVVDACVEWESQFTLKLLLQLIQGSDDRLKGETWPALWKHTYPNHTVKWRVLLRVSSANINTKWSSLGFCKPLWFIYFFSKWKVLD